MVVLFDRTGATIRKHINNVFSEQELSRTSNVLSVALEGVNQNVSYYSLDVIISVGYRVKSQRGVQFRQWATKVLKKYMYEGYVINEQLNFQKYQELSSVVRVIGRTIHRQEKLSGDEAIGLIQVVDDYVYALDTLDNYDYQRLEISNTTCNITFHATYENAMDAINVIKEKYGESSLFGNEKDDSFKSSIGQIY